MPYRYLLTILSVSVALHVAHAKLIGIFPAQSFSEAQKKINKHLLIPRETLLAIDIDLTLTAAHHPALHFPAYKKNKEVFEGIFRKKKPLHIEKAFTLGILLSGQRLLDPSAPAFIKCYQKQSVKVIGFTASLVGPLGPVSSIEYMRYQILLSLGMDFSKAFPEKNIIFRNIQLYNDQFPLYYQGILFANGGRAPHTKGDVIRSFLKRVKFRPKLLIIIDDRLKNIEEIASALEFYDPQIDVLGIEFTRGQTYQPDAISSKDFQNYWRTLSETVL